MQIKKQFIAGARCPQCEKIDVVQLWQAVNLPGEVAPLPLKKMFCSACGHEEELVDTVQETVVNDEKSVVKKHAPKAFFRSL